MTRKSRNLKIRWETLILASRLTFSSSLSATHGVHILNLSIWLLKLMHYIPHSQSHYLTIETHGLYSTFSISLFDYCNSWIPHSQSHYLAPLSLHLPSNTSSSSSCSSFFNCTNLKDLIRGLGTWFKIKKNYKDFYINFLFIIG